MTVLFAICYALLAIFSYAFVNPGSPFPRLPVAEAFIFSHRLLATAIYSFLIVFAFLLYWQILRLVKQKKLTSQAVWRLIFLTIIILFFSYPAFSYDLFNYLATARVTFLHRENPYLIMPIEIPNEPMLEFMHAANKTALYGPVWILLTALPHFAGMGHLFLTIFTFKFLMALFYLVLLWLIWQLSNKNPWALAFFGLNPLVTIQTLVDGHNDVVMMALVLLAFYLLKKRRFCLAMASLLSSILIKFATLFLLPVFIWTAWSAYRRTGKKKINWPAVWRWSALSMMLIFLLSPLREELYAWYLIWPLTFAAFLPAGELLAAIILAFSFGLMFRLASFLYTASWVGATPLIKEIVSFLPPSLTFFYLKLKR